MRLIDADAIRGKAVPHTRGEHGWNAEIRKWAVLVGDIDDAPTVDAVEVVRCKDCKRSEVWGTEKRIDCEITYSRVCLRFLTPKGVKDEDFCSYGERRTDNG